MHKILLVLRETQAISACNGFQPACQRISVNILIYIRGMDDLCQSQKPRLFEAIFEDDRLKRAASIGAMTQFDSRRIKGDRAGFLDNLFDLAGGDKQEFRFVVNEARDQPGTGDTINMYMRPGNPFHFLFSFLCVTNLSYLCLFWIFTIVVHIHVFRLVVFPDVGWQDTTDSAQEPKVLDR